MCTSPHSMTEELKMYLPSVGSFLAGLFSFPLLQPQIRHSYFLPSSENRVLFLHLNGIHVFFFFFSSSFTFSDHWTLELFQLQGSFSLNINCSGSVKRLQCFILFFVARLLSDPILECWSQWTLGSSRVKQEMSSTG